MSQNPVNLHDGEHRAFEQRKRDHIEQALLDKNQAIGMSGLAHVRLIHEALPDLNFEDLSLATRILGVSARTPLYINSMTAGHRDAKSLNLVLAEACSRQGWILGVGSQRRELSDGQAHEDWFGLRKKFPDLFVFGNLGISQVIQSKSSDIQSLIEGLRAQAIAIHLNPLQECLQPEGTPQFRGGFDAIKKLVHECQVPIIVKETGCGINASTAQRLSEAGVHVVDVSGLGGTHWGRIEGARAAVASVHDQAAQTFSDWGISTVDCLRGVYTKKLKAEIWASGGVRSGLDAAKLLGLGAQAVGFAQPALEPALRGVDALINWMRQIEYELRVALFCTNSAKVDDLKGKVL